MKDLIEKVDKLAELAGELKQQLRGGSQSDAGGIDWGKMPEDTLVLNELGNLRHLSHMVDGKVYVFPNGVSSMTHGWVESLVLVSNPRLAKNQPWRPWFGGKCPVDPNVAVDYLVRSAQSDMDYERARAGHLRWDWRVMESIKSRDIIAWRISDKQEIAR